MKLNHRILYFILTLILLTGCASKPEKANESRNKLYTNVYVGITPGIHYTILNKINELVNDDGYMVIIKIYEDPEKLISAVKANDIDVAYGITASEYSLWGAPADSGLFPLEANMFEPFLLFSLKNKWPIPENSIVAVPGNSLDLDRVLRFLRNEDIISLADNKEKLYTLEDITENPYQYQFFSYIQEDFAKISVYADAAVLAASVVIESVLTLPEKYILEKRNSSLYDDILLVKEEAKNRKEIQKLKNIFASEELKTYIYEQYLGSLEVIP